MPSRRWTKGSTASWRRVRMQVLNRDAWRCRLKLEGCTTKATQVHHTSPRELVGDVPEYLIATCAHCNIIAGAPEKHDPDPTTAKWWVLPDPTEPEERPKWWKAVE